ncbi:MAG: DUF3089 domain-containing protein [Victivallales bacterium]|jgi:hypothetical protein|nr:DUF3089 domain-containing protein [Victivallales bacterium]
MKKFSTAILLLLSLLMFAFAGCDPTVVGDPPIVESAPKSRFIDYSDKSNWVLLPEISADELKAVDIFYIYPTVFVSKDDALMRWDAAEMQTKTRNIARQQTAMFTTLGNIYAPFVRQAELNRALTDLSDPQSKYPSMETGVQDTINAFAHYLRYYNKGRPFILVGHSQGALDLFELLKRHFSDPALQNKLIVAYLIGCPVTTKDLTENPHLKVAAGELDLGVIVTWNTEAEVAVRSPFTGRPGSYCINPLNWRTDAVPASASANLGAVFFDGENHVTSEIPSFCGAQIRPETGALIVTPACSGKYDSTLLGAGIYHMNDIYFFYRNLEANARDRAANYLNNSLRAYQLIMEML